jgi:pimeloyl-ACP methyl ester carboxylesterase
MFRPLEVPGLVIAGEQDGCMKAELFDGAEKAFAVEGELYRVEGAGHFMHLEKPSEVAAAVRRWVEAHPVNVA